MLYRKKELIHVLKVDQDGATVHNVGNEDDTWVIPLGVFNSSYEPVAESESENTAGDKKKRYTGSWD